MSKKDDELQEKLNQRYINARKGAKKRAKIAKRQGTTTWGHKPTGKKIETSLPDGHDVT